ncbi:MAG: universal stress protein [Brumimicrobium sp.]
MKKFNKIRLLTDFSEVSENATEYAVLLAKKMAVEVEIMHIVSTPVDWVKLDLEREKLYPEAKEKIIKAKNDLNDLISKFKEQNISAKSSLIFNIGVESISNYLGEDTDNLLIMGSHGASGIKEYTLGSNAEKIIRKAICPVLVVKNKPQKQEITSLVFASTFQEDQLEPFQKVCQFSEELDLERHLLYINTPYNFKETQDIESMLNSFCKEDGNNSCKKHVFNALNEYKGIKDFMQDESIDVFSIATEGRSSFTQLFLPSLTEKIVNHLDIPVLSIHTV